MGEKLEVYDLDGNLIGIQDRDEFYKEIKAEFAKTGKITKAVKTIKLLLLNSNGRIFLQKRSKLKTENTGLYDKTVGGHVSAGDTFELTTIRECAEELGFPAAVISEEMFSKAVKVTNLNIIGIFKKVDFLPIFLSERLTIKSKFIQPLMNSMYVGYYNGPIKFVDGESSGIEVFSLDELKEEIHDYPDKFTEDLKFMINKYESYLVPLKTKDEEVLGY